MVLDICCPTTVQGKLGRELENELFFTKAIKSFKDIPAHLQH